MRKSKTATMTIELIHCKVEISPMRNNMRKNCEMRKPTKSNRLKWIVFARMTAAVVVTVVAAYDVVKSIHVYKTNQYH